MILTDTTTSVKLPDGWHYEPLGKRCEIIAGQSPPSDTYNKKQEGLPFFQGKADFGNKYPIVTTWCKTPIKIALPNDILISVRAPVGPTNIANIKCCIGRGLAAIRCTDETYFEYIIWVMKLFERDISESGSGSTFSAIKVSDLSKLKIPLPPTVEEQKRIATLLTEQMAAVEKARKAAEARLEAARALTNAYLRQVFESEEAKEWPIVRLRKVCRQIDYGFTASADFTIKEPRFLRITDIQNGNVNWDVVPGCNIGQTEELASKLYDGDIVFARTGGTVGKSLLIITPPRAVFASYLIRLSPDKNIINPEYIYAFLQSNGYWRQLRMASRGGAQPNVNATLLGNLELPVPSIEKQKAGLSFLRTKMNYVNRLIETTQQELEAINSLPATLLRKAFTGGM